MLDKMKNSYIFIIFLLIFIPNVLATDYLAESENYSFQMHTIGIQGALIEGSSLSGRTHSTAFQMGTKDAVDGIYVTNIGFFGNASNVETVSITSYSIYPSSGPNGSIIRFAISARNASAVWAHIDLPDSSNETITLTNNDYTYYTSHVVGIHNITFYANDTYGSIASAVDEFEITATVETPVTPVVNSPSGGGGGGGSCTYSWTCDAWSICSNSLQTRVCKNKGSCTGTKDKPIETQSCSDILFDVLLKLNKVEIKEKENLNFGVELIEARGSEKVDVQIKYSIFNEQGRQIFSQIETRAVEKTVCYNKTFDEIVFTPGNYKLRVEIFYGDSQRANAEHIFTVAESIIKVTGPIVEKPENFIKKLWNSIKNLYSEYSEGIKLTALILFSLILLLVIALVILKKIYKTAGAVIPSLNIEMYHLNEGRKILTKSFNSESENIIPIQVNEGDLFGLSSNVINDNLNNYKMNITNINSRNKFRYDPNTRTASIRFEKPGEDKIICNWKNSIIGTEQNPIIIRIKVLPKIKSI